ncbi:MAG: hypothetical protein WC782_03365 [Methylococcaceae bacterium]|jgi:hypothetical protein
MKSTNASGLLLATAVASLFVAGPVMAAEHDGAKEAKVHCGGINECKGHSECKTASNACKGQNACKGKGFVATTEEECTAKGGKVEAPAK